MEKQIQEAMERGDFAQGSYTARVRRGANKTQVQLQRIGNAWGIPLTLTKGITLSAGSNELEIAYLIEGLPQHETLHFAVELNFAGMPAGADDRYFRDAQGQRLGELGQWLNLEGVEQLDLVDEWLGLDVSWSVNQPSHVWTFPIASVSQSEGGFEMVHQSVVAMPHWWISGDAQGRWSCIMKLDLATPRHSSPLSSTSESAQVV